MQIVSDSFKTAMDNRPYIARITLDGVDAVQGDVVVNINFHGGMGDNAEAVSLGCAVAGSVEISLQKELVTVAVAGREMFVELGIDIDGEIEWLPMGTYTAGDVTEDGGIITIPGLDAMAAKFEKDYTPLDGLDFTAEGGVDSNVLVQAVCESEGVAVDTAGLESVALKVSPDGYTKRQILGMLAALSGKIPYVDRRGEVRFRWYEAADVTITDDEYYSGGMEKAAYSFCVGWIKCFVDGLEETLYEGNPGADQGIYFECPWMTQERLALLWEQLQGFTYCPMPALSFQGDPRLDPGDIITMVDGEGQSVSVPITSISHEYDGGLITEVSADGQLKTESYEGPVQREVKRTAAKILKKAGEIELSIQDLDSKTTLSMIKMTEDMVHIEATVNAGKEMAENAAVGVQSIQQNGVSKVKTVTGYTFDADGLRIQKSGQEIENLLDHTGMYVTRSGETMLQANANGVVATDVSVRNYLNMGDHARFEDYNNGTDNKRTACFWREGE